MPTIGQLKPVDVRTIWPNEEKHFTPWVASEEGLKLLGEWVGLSLKRGRSEEDIGQFRADIVCDDVSDPQHRSEVVIENQLSTSDHDHLGKLLTYSSAIKAESGIWIATDFAPEHLAAVQAWNRPTDRTLSLYCVRIAAWRIGRSAAAPTFDVLVRPDSQVPVALQLAPTANIRATRRRFWIKLREVMLARGIETTNTSAWGTYQRFEIGDEMHPVACLSVTRDSSQNRARLYLQGGWHQEVFQKLEEDRTNIDEALGSRPDWNPGDDHCTVGFSSHSHFFDESRWSEDIEWMIDKLDLLRRVFKPRSDEMRPSETIASRSSDEAGRIRRSSSG